MEVHKTEKTSNKPECAVTLDVSCVAVVSESSNRKARFGLTIGPTIVTDESLVMEICYERELERQVWSSTLGAAVAKYALPVYRDIEQHAASDTETDSLSGSLGAASPPAESKQEQTQEDAETTSVQVAEVRPKYGAEIYYRHLQWRLQTWTELVRMNETTVWKTRLHKRGLTMSQPRKRGKILLVQIRCKLAGPPQEVLAYIRASVEPHGRHSLFDGHVALEEMDGGDATVSFGCYQPQLRRVAPRHVCILRQWIAHPLPKSDAIGAVIISVDHPMSPQPPKGSLEAQVSHSGIILTPVFSTTTAGGGEGATAVQAPDPGSGSAESSFGESSIGESSIGESSMFADEESSSEQDEADSKGAQAGSSLPLPAAAAASPSVAATTATATVPSGGGDAITAAAESSGVRSAGGDSTAAPAAAATRSREYSPPPIRRRRMSADERAEADAATVAAIVAAAAPLPTATAAAPSSQPPLFCSSPHRALRTRVAEVGTAAAPASGGDGTVPKKGEGAIGTVCQPSSTTTARPPEVATVPAIAAPAAAPATASAAASATAASPPSSTGAIADAAATTGSSQHQQAAMPMATSLTVVVAVDLRKSLRRLSKTALRTGMLRSSLVGWWTALLDEYNASRA